MVASAVILMVLVCSFGTTDTKKDAEIESIVADLLLIFGGEVFYDLIEGFIPAEYQLVVHEILQKLQPEFNEIIRKCGDDLKCRKLLVHFKFKQTVKEFITLDFLGDSLLEKIVIMSTAHATRLVKGAAAVAFVADLGQFVLEYYGYTTAGKVVGAMGYIGAGSMLGCACAVAQVPCAIIGGVFGSALWLFTERQFTKRQFTERQFTESEYHQDITKIASL
jgi:hypothetical protein